MLFLVNLYQSLLSFVCLFLVFFPFWGTLTWVKLTLMILLLICLPQFLQTVWLGGTHLGWLEDRCLVFVLLFSSGITDLSEKGPHCQSVCLTPFLETHYQEMFSNQVFLCTFQA